MALEIERKFLVDGDAWRTDVISSERMQQAYLCVEPLRCIRVRIADSGAHINLKSSRDGISRHEYEYTIPVSDAQEMLERMCVGSVVDKTRHRIPMDELVWEVDEFHGENDGLIVAEIELADRDQVFRRPSWLGREVSGDTRVYNMSLALSPYSQWSAEDE